MVIALRSGVPASAWLDDVRALLTAEALYAEADREAAREMARAKHSGRGNRSTMGGA